ncbi:nitroreductase [Pseudooceanicola aestuarii]|uniref:nitroreductase n=1 Tax=Pseudooceanicola aestuarii TaxID=2697319 RepID=UPI0013D033C7|nr:nitroreductase [Pseudooceanicola aestuarii]
MTDLAAFDALMAQRFSCRAFRPDPLPDAVIAGIVRTAGRTPSWSNTQTWQVLITRGAETDRFRNALLEEVRGGGTPASDLPWPDGYSGIHQARRREVGWALYEAVGVKKGDREGAARQGMENFRLFGAPHVAIVTAGEELGAWGALDCGGFVTAFCLAARAAGVDTIAQAALAGYAPMIHRHFDIPRDRLVLCAISFGHADADHPANSFRASRAALDEILEWRG